MAEDNFYVDEFLVRGVPPGSKGKAAWHVAIGNVAPNALGEMRPTAPVYLNMAQAKEKGFTLPKIISKINADLAETNDRLKEELSEKESEVQHLREENRQLHAVLAILDEDEKRKQRELAKIPT